MSERNGIVLVTGGSGYIAGFCIAHLIREGWCVRTTVRSLGREAKVRAALGTVVELGDRLKFAAADLNSDKGWAEAVAGCKRVLHVASPIPTRTPATTRSWSARRATAPCACCGSPATPVSRAW